MDPAAYYGYNLSFHLDYILNIKPSDEKNSASEILDYKLNCVQETLSATVSTQESIAPIWGKIELLLSSEKDINLKQEILTTSILSVAQSRFGFDVSKAQTNLSEHSKKYLSILNTYDPTKKNVPDLVDEILDLFSSESEQVKNQLILQLINSKKAPLEQLKFDKDGIRELIPYLIAQLINSKKVSLDQLKFSEDDIQELIPYLKVFDFRGCEDSLTCKMLDYLKKYPEYSYNVRELYLKNCTFEEWPEIPNCLYLSCPGCPNIEVLPKVPLCLEIDCSGCKNLVLAGENKKEFSQCRILNCSNCPNFRSLIGFENCIRIDCSNCYNLSLEEPSINESHVDQYGSPLYSIFPYCQYFDCRECSSLALDVSEQLPSVTVRGLELGEKQKTVLKVSLDKGLVSDPLEILIRLYGIIQKDKSLPYIRYVTEEGINAVQDIGGVTRDFITRLLASLFVKKGEGLYLREDLYLKEELYQEEDLEMNKEDMVNIAYIALGELLIMSYYEKSKIKLGALFSLKDYNLLMKELPLNSEENKIEFFLEKWGIPKEAKACFLEKETLELRALIEKNPLAEGSVEKNIFEFIWYSIHDSTPEEESLKKIQSMLENTKLREFMRKTALTKAPKHPDFIKFFYIISGAIKLVGADEWNRICQLGAEHFKERVEGTINADDFKANLSWRPVEGISQDQLGNVRSWMKKWIDNAGEKELKDLLFAMTGNVALVPGKKLEIQVVNKPANSFPIAATCFFKLELSANIQDENAFNEHMQALIASAKSDQQAGGALFQLG